MNNSIKYFSLMNNFLEKVCRSIVSAVLLFLLSVSGNASGGNLVSKIDKEIPISYYGRVITHPGLKTGIVYTLLGNDTSSVFSIKTHLSAGMYYHRNNQYAYFCQLEINPALSFFKTWFVSLPLGIGYMRTFLDGKVYSVDNSGNVEQEYFKGSNYLMTSGGLSIGSRIRGKRIGRIFLTLGCFGQYPYNSYMLPNLYCEIGATWKRK